MSTRRRKDKRTNHLEGTEEEGITVYLLLED
jgi:hypothetical protein